jgi:hypothetical protein
MKYSALLALLGLALAGNPALAAKRGESSGQRPETRVAQAKAATGAQGRAAKSVPSLSGRRSAPAAGPRPAMLWQAAPIRGRLAVTHDDRAASASGACLRVRGTTRCRPQSVLGGSISGWARDLPPAAGVQAEECPAGTMATLARGHEDIVRCMPI